MLNIRIEIYLLNVHGGKIKLIFILTTYRTHINFSFCYPVITNEFLIALKKMIVQEFYINNVVTFFKYITIEMACQMLK